MFRGILRFFLQNWCQEVTTLEFNSFLERKLWPGFDADKASSLAHLITIALLINEKADIGARRSGWITSTTMKSHEAVQRFHDEQVRDGSVSAWDSVAARKEKWLGCSIGSFFCAWTAVANRLMWLAVQQSSDAAGEVFELL